MEYKIAIHQLALDDILEIARWYDYQSPGLGNKFEENLEAAIQKINTQPFSYRIIYGSIRRIHLKHFPYLIFYEILVEEVLIYGVIHSKRNPKAIKSRFKNFTNR